MRHPIIIMLSLFTVGLAIASAVNEPVLREA